jgi:hypothetical protein
MNGKFDGIRKADENKLIKKSNIRINHNRIKRVYSTTPDLYSRDA